jgi:type I restriction enzyme S subunit
MTQKAKAPAIRFKGFTDAWEQRKFSEVIKSHSFRPYLAEPIETGNYKVIQQGDNPVVGYSDGEPFKSYEDVILFGDHTVSLYKPIKPFFVATDGVKILSGDGFDGRYFYSTLERYKPESQGYKRHFTILKKENVWFTKNKDEQQKIGEFFRDLDNLITLHQRKLLKLKNIKKAMLEKMFPKNGSNVSEIRFDGFRGGWEQRKLGELCDVYDGTHQTPNYQNNGIMFLSVENINSLKSEKYISEEDFIKDFNIFPEKGDVLMTRIGDIGTANVVESNEPKAYYVSLALLKKKALDPYFLKESISSETVKNDLWKRTLHIAFPKKINKNEIAEVLVPYPEKREEQEQIGMFFKNLDNLIALHQRKLEKLQNLKKACLRKMFV